MLSDSTRRRATMAGMSPRFRRVARAIAIGLLLLPLLLVITVRLLRHQASAPDPTAAGVVRVRNLFTDLYGVRVGDRIVVFDAGIDGEGNALDALIKALGGSGRDAVTDVFLLDALIARAAAP